MEIHKFPLCCGIAVICGFGNDPRHAGRDARRGHADQTIEDIERFLRVTAEQAAGPHGITATDGQALGRVGMLLAAVNIPQRAALAATFRRLGWRRAGKANNLHVVRGDSDIFLYRKVLAEARTDD